MFFIKKICLVKQDGFGMATTKLKGFTLPVTDQTTTAYYITKILVLSTQKHGGY